MLSANQASPNSVSDLQRLQEEENALFLEKENLEREQSLDAKIYQRVSIKLANINAEMAKLNDKIQKLELEWKNIQQSIEASNQVPTSLREQQRIVQCEIDQCDLEIRVTTLKIDSIQENNQQLLHFIHISDGFGWLNEELAKQLAIAEKVKIDIKQIQQNLADLAKNLDKQAQLEIGEQIQNFRLLFEDKVRLFQSTTEQISKLNLSIIDLFNRHPQFVPTKDYRALLQLNQNDLDGFVKVISDMKQKKNDALDSYKALRPKAEDALEEANVMHLVGIQINKEHEIKSFREQLKPLNQTFCTYMSSLVTMQSNMSKREKRLNEIKMLVKENNRLQYECQHSEKTSAAKAMRTAIQKPIRKRWRNNPSIQFVQKNPQTKNILIYTPNCQNEDKAIDEARQRRDSIHKFLVKKSEEYKLIRSLYQQQKIRCCRISRTVYFIKNCDDDLGMSFEDFINSTLFSPVSATSKIVEEKNRKKQRVAADAPTNSSDTVSTAITSAQIPTGFSSSPTNLFAQPPQPMDQNLSQQNNQSMVYQNNIYFDDMP